NDPNNSPPPVPSPLPTARRRGKLGPLLLPLVALLVVGIVSLVGWILLFGGGGRRNDLVWHAVHYDRLQLSIVERGALESANNCDVVCRVKAKAQGSTVSTTIKWV